MGHSSAGAGEQFVDLENSGDGAQAASGPETESEAKVEVGEVRPGRDDGAEEELVHCVLRGVHPVSERVIFLAEEKSPERHQASPLRHSQPAGVGVEAVDVEGEEEEDVGDDGHLEAEAGHGQEADKSRDPGSEETRGDGQVTSSTEGVILRTDLKIDLLNELYITASQASNNLLPSPISQVSCWQHLKDPTKHLFLTSLLNNLSLYNVT